MATRILQADDCQAVRGTIVSHFWVNNTDGKLTLHEADYWSYPIREGVLCYQMVPHSDRSCACPEREVHERRLAGFLK
jgi:hypothetical protein